MRDSVMVQEESKEIGKPEEEEPEAVLALRKGILACSPLHGLHSPKWSDSSYSD